jgi:hypothetical protein
MPAEIRPREPLVGRLVDARTGTRRFGLATPADANTAAASIRNREVHLEGRENCLWTLRVEHHVDGAYVVAFVQHLGPRLAAICGAEHAAFFVARVGVAQCRRQYDVGILGVDGERHDVMRVSETEMLPVRTGVHRLPHAVANIDGLLDAAHVARADVDGVGIGARNGDRPDRLLMSLIEDRLPRGAAAGAFPDPAARSPEIISGRVARNSRNRGDSSRPKRPHLPPSHAAIK